MSATIHTASSPAVSLVPATQAGAGDADTAFASSDAGNPEQFTALFQQLLGKQISADVGQNAMVLPAGTAIEVDPAQLSDTLAALLPFLDALGLTKNDARKAAGDVLKSLTEVSAEGSPLAGLAVALSPQSANDPAISAARERFGNLGKSPAGGVAKLAAQALSVADAASDGGRGLAAKGEFSSQLSIALNSAGEKTLPQFLGNASGHAPQAMGLSHAQGIGAPMPTLPIAQTVGAPGWGQELGNRIAWMANRMESRAELVLTPPQMGRIEVSLTVAGDQASAIFTSANPVVREALEAAMPRLREMLADAGIQLGQAQVGAENSRQSAQQEKNGDNFAFGQDATSNGVAFQTITDTPSTPSGLKMGRGLVDVFA
ncbi:MAG: flagellar hook-length control protein FliK [Gammaproteobacteria bacterium]|nr:hypothetical protein [Rhodocyclaceae bacterium]MBU3909539.1 flagellar hook-length control protein FliK [Gammaproteobacteria bacterium]MBU3987935.1 flagellar hook-length control protein FliK [Gammaproteobacteria bacterium]MBU4003202.1 flagellar hook-length control protein FliK [Gammaproteobacteria bacterium]MBU4022251.1 flagellar hook-length control protein FliK [Gammaproteobacteria bacterium]